MKLNPFIEAKKSRAATSTRRATCSRCLSPPTASAAMASLRREGHRRRDAQADHRHLHRVRPHLLRPKDPLGAPASPCGAREGWVTRLMRAASLEGRCKKHWRKTTIAEPGA